MPPLHTEVAPHERFAPLDELLAVNRWLVVSYNEEADVVRLYQYLDFVQNLLGIARATRAPELPLQAEAARERTAARNLGMASRLLSRMYL